MFCGRSASTEQAEQPDAPKKGRGWDIAIGSALKGTGKGRAVNGLKLLDAHEADGHPGVQPPNIDDGGDGTESGGDSDSEDESENSDHSCEAGPAAAGAASQKTKKRPGKKPSPFDKKIEILNKNACRDVFQLRRALYVLGAGDPDRTALVYAKFCNEPKLRKARMVGRHGNVDTVCMDSLLRFFDNEATVTKGTRLLAMQRAIHHMLLMITPSNARERRVTKRIADRLNRRQEVIRNMSHERKKFEERGFRDYTRATRYDKRDLDWIRDMSHDEAISRLDTFAKKRVKVQYSDGHVEEHDQHTLVTTRRKAAEYILNSEQYREWQSANLRRGGPKRGQPLELSPSLVMAGLCGCLRDPHWRECADELKTAVREFVAGWEALRIAARRDQLTCKCTDCAERRLAEVSDAVFVTQNDMSMLIA